MGFWVGILNRRNWCLTVEPTISEGATFRTSRFMSRDRFEDLLEYLHYTYKRMLDSIISSYTCVKWKKKVNLTWLNSLIHRGLMYWKKLSLIGLTDMFPYSCVLGVNLTIFVMKDTLFVVV